MQPGGRLDLTVVVPYYNPGPNLAGHVAQVIELLRDRGVRFEVIAVSDGSTDGSDAGLAELGDEVQVVYLPVNQGKGHALRVGLGLGRGSYLGFIDGDGDIPAPVLGEFVSCIQRERPDFAIGSKRHPESMVVYPRLRRFYSWGYQVLTRVLFGLDVTDTQSGIKLARREIVTELLPILEEDGFTFDLELLAVARRLGYTRVVELPVEIRERFSSTVSPRAAWDMLVDTVRLTWRLRIAHHYDKAIARPATCRRLSCLRPRRLGRRARPNDALGHQREPFHDPVDTGGQGLDVGGLDGREERDSQLVPSQLAVGLGVYDAVRAEDGGHLEGIDAFVEVDRRGDVAPFEPDRSRTAARSSNARPTRR